jgi:arsenate reductase-like glutaredoxin family protein
LKRHVHHEDFLDFVSRRSPVFKHRALPKSKREAIALMTDNPKLIRRPVLIVGRHVAFGFDKARYTDLVKSSH